jgi:hypothetical protein
VFPFPSKSGERTDDIQDSGRGGARNRGSSHRHTLLYRQPLRRISYFYKKKLYNVQRVFFCRRGARFWLHLSPGDHSRTSGRPCGRCCPGCCSPADETRALSSGEHLTTFYVRRQSARERDTHETNEVWGAITELYYIVQWTMRER